jgi:beta-N-acetylhexosaminidase
MPADVIYDQIDPLPAGFSPFWLKKVLRERFDFQGVIFSDDLDMAAAGVAGDYRQRARSALQAGCDMVLVCNNRPAALQVLDELKDYSNLTSQARLVRMHGRKEKTANKLRLDIRWKQAVKLAANAQLEGSALSLDL